MPNYTKNHLIVSGKKGVLKYFYERNRVSKEDSKYLNVEQEEQRPLSFNKCVPREVQIVFEKYISNNYLLNSSKLSKSKESISWDLMVSIWGTKWDAIDSTVDISFFEEEDSQVREEGSINYTFMTAGSYPYNWLLIISKLFPNLLFEITYSNEYDSYINTYIEEYKNGTIISEKSYNALEKSMNNYTISEIVELIITYFTDENRYISYYDEKNKKDNKIHWLTYCKSYIEEYSNDESSVLSIDDNLFLDILCQIQDVMDTYGFHEAIYTNKELCKAFADKIRSM